MKSSAERLENTSLLPDVIYRKLRLDILNGVLEPGQNLRQEELAKGFQVSRVPLREAMSRLEADGLIVLRPRRGYVVNSLDQGEIVEIFELRMVIEEHAGLIAARSRTADDIRQLERIMKQMEALDEKALDYVSRWSHLNREFHALLVSSSRRQRLAHIASTLRDSVESYVRVETRMTGNVREAEREHREIFEAFKAGDAQGLASLCRKHLESTSRRLLEGLRRKAAASNAHLSN